MRQKQEILCWLNDCYEAVEIHTENDHVLIEGGHTRHFCSQECRRDYQIKLMLRGASMATVGIAEI